VQIQVVFMNRISASFFFFFFVCKENSSLLDFQVLVGIFVNRVFRFSTGLTKHSKKGEVEKLSSQLGFLTRNFFVNALRMFFFFKCLLKNMF
jgi:hypothetical protein